MSHTRTTGLLAALALGALLMAGCSSGGGEPKVDASVHELLQQEYDAALADLRAERGARQAAQTARNAAQAEVTRLTGELETANGRVTALQTQIGAATDAANPAATASLHAQLNAAKADVTVLTAQIGAATDAANPAATASLHAQLNAAKADVTRLETLIGDPANPSATSLRGQLAAAIQRATTAEAALETVRGQLTTAQQELETAEEEAEEAQQQAEEARQEAEQRTSDLDANQRAQNLRSTFPGTFTAAPVSPVDMTVSRGGLRLTRSRHSDATLSGAGIRSATMTLTAGGDSGKTVIYTDRELSRKLTDHYGAQWDKTNARFNLLLTAAADAASGIAVGSINYPGTGQTPAPKWRITPSGVPTSLTGEDLDDNAATPTTLPSGATTDNTKMATSYPGDLYGLSGSFVCAGVDGCQVQAAPTYSPAPTTPTSGRHALQSVALTATDVAGTVYFKPDGSPSIQLYEGGPVGPDAEYMEFGYWREDPTSAAGIYRFGVFAEVTAPDGAPTGAFPAFGATYDGTAVGAYVEQDPNDPVDTHRQGEFTADVSLTATSATAVYGTVDDFVVTPTGGSAAPRTSDRWVLTLINNGPRAVHLNLAGGGTRGNPADGAGTVTTTTGAWTHAFVPHHAHTADAANTAPPAVTGVFVARIVDFLHLVGAYGAER